MPKLTNPSVNELNKAIRDSRELTGASFKHFVAAVNAYDTLRQAASAVELAGSALSAAKAGKKSLGIASLRQFAEAMGLTFTYYPARVVLGKKKGKS